MSTTIAEMPPVDQGAAPPPTLRNGTQAMAETIVAELADESAFADLVAAIQGDLRVLESQQQAVAREMTHLVETTLPGCFADVELLRGVAGHLEMTFARVDRLQAVMDKLHHIVLHLNEVLKTISEPTSVKERASGLLRSFGIKQSPSEALWARVPVRIVVDGTTPFEFNVRVKTLLRQLATLEVACAAESQAAAAAGADGDAAAAAADGAAAVADEAAAEAQAASAE